MVAVLSIFILDMTSTLIFLSRGLKEGNSILNYALSHSFIGWILYLTIGVILLTFLATRTERVEKYFKYVYCIVATLVIVGNVVSTITLT